MPSPKDGNVVFLRVIEPYRSDNLRATICPNEHKLRLTGTISRIDHAGKQVPGLEVEVLGNLTDIRVGDTTIPEHLMTAWTPRPATETSD